LLLAFSGSSTAENLPDLPVRLEESGAKVKSIILQRKLKCSLFGFFTATSNEHPERW